VDKLRLAWIYLRSALISRERLESYDAEKWADYVAPFSPKVKRWILDSTAIFLGMDYAKLSKHFIYNMFRTPPKVCNLIDPAHKFYSFDGPMNIVLFNSWMRRLREQGVVVRTGTSVKKINLSSAGRIESITTCATTDQDLLEKSPDADDVPAETQAKAQEPELADEDTFRDSPHLLMQSHARTEDAKEEKQEFYDIYVNAMDAGSLSALYPTLDSNKKTMGQSIEFWALHENSRQIQTQVLYYVPYSLEMPWATPTIIILHDTPWFLMIRMEQKLFDLNNECLLSTGIGIWDKPGVLHAKNAINCTREEIAKECWAQIKRSQTNLKLGQMPEWDIWNTFKFDEKRQELDTVEPKFSNNVHTLQLRPKPKDAHISNLYHATAYTRTLMDIYNMESGCEAGVRVATMINGAPCESDSSDLLRLQEPAPGIFLRICRAIDRFFFKLFG
jgi:hypothetical protein